MNLNSSDASWSNTRGVKERMKEEKKEQGLEKQNMKNRMERGAVLS